MIRDNWRTLGFWRWWWRSCVPANAKITAAVVLSALVLVGGYFASAHLTGAKAAGRADSYVLQTTISKVITVKEHGRTIVKRVPVVVRRTIVHSSTAYATQIDTRIVTTPGGLRYVTKKVVRYVPVVHKRTVVVNGKTRTVTETRLVPTVSVVTNQQTVTNQSTVVVNKPSTVTTVETQTVTLPALTVTETQTQTETVTETETVVTTVQSPPETTTITITLPLP